MSQLPVSLEQLRDDHGFSELDVHLAANLTRVGGDSDPTVALAIAIASRALAAGCVCVTLRDDPPIPLREGVSLPPLPPPDAWLATLRRSPLIGDGTTLSPLVLDGHDRLYLHRFYTAERRLVRALLDRARRRTDVDEPKLHQWLEQLFGPSNSSEPNRQKIAAMVAATRDLCVITGGPGTGKTTTVLKLLALLQAQRPAGSPRLRVALLAPTGKAATRLAESIVERLGELGLPKELHDAIPTEASTIHRRLGYRPGGGYRHNATHPIPADVVVVDESSMVHLELMADLVDATRPDARLILLGDRDQLASVEAGAILGDICNDGRGIPGYSAAMHKEIEALAGEPAPHYASVLPHAGIWDHIVELVGSHRFRAGSGIASFSAGVNDGDADAAIAALESSADAKLQPIGPGERSDQAIHDLLREPIEAYLSTSDPSDALAALGRFRVLTPHRRGPSGAERKNREIEQWLASISRIDPRDEWYSHRPIMILRNDYNVKLFNGDVGVTLRDADGTSRVYFPSSEGGEIRSFHPARLPEHETVFAMTVHKSQGSEFDDVVLLLPADDSPILNRELIYTGATRARGRLTLVGSVATLRAAIAKRVRRPSGLRDALWSDLNPPADDSGSTKQQRFLFE